MNDPTRRHILTAAAAAMAAMPGVFWKTWGPALTAQRSEITMPTVDTFVTRMFETDPDVVFTVTRDFVRGGQTPILVLPDDLPHPYAVAMESAMLAPKAEVSMHPVSTPAGLPRRIMGRWPPGPTSSRSHLPCRASRPTPGMERRA